MKQLIQILLKHEDTLQSFESLRRCQKETEVDSSEQQPKDLRHSDDELYKGYKELGYGEQTYQQRPPQFHQMVETSQHQHKQDTIEDDIFQKWYGRSQPQNEKRLQRHERLSPQSIKKLKQCSLEECWQSLEKLQEDNKQERQEFDDEYERSNKRYQQITMRLAELEPPPYLPKTIQPSPQDLQQSSQQTNESFNQDYEDAQLTMPTVEFQTEPAHKLLDLNKKHAVCIFQVEDLCNYLKNL